MKTYLRLNSITGGEIKRTYIHANMHMHMLVQTYNYAHMFTKSYDFVFFMRFLQIFTIVSEYQLLLLKELLNQMFL